jgi:hypothetical protein
MRHLDRILDTSPVLLRLSSQAELIARARRVYSQFVPAALSQVSAVMNVKSGKMLLRADSGAVAARLRQLAPSLIGRLQIEGLDVRDVIVQTQPGLEPRSAAIRTGGGREVSVRSQRDLRDLVQTLPEGDPLRRSLERLLARAATTREP